VRKIKTKKRKTKTERRTGHNVGHFYLAAFLATFPFHLFLNMKHAKLKLKRGKQKPKGERGIALTIPML
jgi:hypothetical protein